MADKPRELAQWLVSLESDPAARRTVTLRQIIDRAAEALEEPRVCGRDAPCRYEPYRQA